MDTENNVVEEFDANSEQEMPTDELKEAIDAQIRKISTQNMILGFQVSCQTILDKIDAFERASGKKSANDYKRLLKDLRKFCSTGLSRKAEEVAKETVEETVQN